ncbi:hypothetical protein QE152_g30124 [Popillia japonica]|uniref:Uncharacterized protein n=1 Tax=Popillia japonica TaxID=7064 RepID=A0AAW1JFT6_POPJA
MQESLRKKATYFKELFEIEGNKPPRIDGEAGGIGKSAQDEPLTEQDIEGIIKKFRNKKTPGETAEMIAYMLY